MAEIKLTVRCKPFSGGKLDDHFVLVEGNDSVLVWDTVAGHYTSVHSLDAKEIKRIVGLARDKARDDAQRTIDRLLSAETDGSNAPDMRRTLSEERQAIMAAMQSGDVERIVTRTKEGARVAKLWGVA